MYANTFNRTAVTMARLILGTASEQCCFAMRNNSCASARELRSHAGAETVLFESIGRKVCSDGGLRTFKVALVYAS